jgi:hypothetical protein
LRISQIKPYNNKLDFLKRMFSQYRICNSSGRVVDMQGTGKFRGQRGFRGSSDDEQHPLKGPQSFQELAFSSVFYLSVNLQIGL